MQRLSTARWSRGSRRSRVRRPVNVEVNIFAMIFALFRFLSYARKTIRAYSSLVGPNHFSFFHNNRKTNVVFVFPNCVKKKDNTVHTRTHFAENIIESINRLQSRATPRNIDA